MVARALGLLFLIGLSTSAAAQEERYYYLRPADYDCLVTKAKLYAQVSGNGPVTVVFRECPRYPTATVRRGQYYPPLPAHGRRNGPIVDPDEVIALSRPQLQCLASGALGKPTRLLDPKTGMVKLSTRFDC